MRCRFGRFCAVFIAFAAPAISVAGHSPSFTARKPADADSTNDLVMKSLIPDSDPALAALLVESRQYVRPFPRPITMFHWTEAQLLDDKPGDVLDSRTPLLGPYVNYKVALFWTHPEDKGGEIGNGLYTAMDPGTSFGFGGDRKAVVEVTVQEGTPFLDLRNETLPLSAPTLDLVAKSGCSAKTLAQIFLINDMGCYKFVPPLLKNLSVYYVAQKWAFTWSAACGEARASIAFMVVDPDLKNDRKDVLAFSEDSDPNGADSHELKNLEQGILDFKLHENHVHIFNKKYVFPDSSATKYLWGPFVQFNSPKDYDQWSSQNLLSCGSSPEDLPLASPSNPPVSQVDLGYSDLVENYIVDLARAAKIGQKLSMKINPVDFPILSKELKKHQLPAAGTSTVLTFDLLHAWDSHIADSPKLQDFLKSLNPKIADLQNHETWAWEGCKLEQQCGFTNPVQLAVAAGQAFLKLDPLPKPQDSKKDSKDDEKLARHLMMYIFRALNQPAALTSDLSGDLMKLSVTDYSSLGDKDLWIAPYAEGMKRLEKCLSKIEKKSEEIHRDSECRIEP